MPHSGNGQGYQPDCERCRNVTRMCADIPTTIAKCLAAHPALQSVREELAREVLYGDGSDEPQGLRKWGASR